MSVGSRLGWVAGTVVICAPLVVGRRYHRWKQRQSLRLQSESCLLETSRGTVEYHTEGTGPVVLVIHGGPGGYDFAVALAHLCVPSGFTRLSLSRPGYRRTPLSSGQTPEAQADLFAATLDALNLTQAAVIAVSGGGPSALQFALRFPHRCPGLVLISPVAHAATEEAVYRSLPPGQRLQSWMVNHLLTSDPVLYLLSALSKRTSQDAQSRAFIESLVLNPLNSSGYLNDMRQISSLTTIPFQRISASTLIVHGTADVEVPFPRTEALASALPHAKLVAIEGADHLTILTSEGALSAIRRFLESLPRGENRQNTGSRACMQDKAM